MWPDFDQLGLEKVTNFDEHRQGIINIRRALDQIWPDTGQIWAIRDCSISSRFEIVGLACGSFPKQSPQRMDVDDMARNQLARNPQYRSGRNWSR